MARESESKSQTQSTGRSGVYEDTPSGKLQDSSIGKSSSAKPKVEKDEGFEKLLDDLNECRQKSRQAELDIESLDDPDNEKEINNLRDTRSAALGAYRRSFEEVVKTCKKELDR